eukprot:5400467-Ditylum_brightwellii.AAC.1
MTKTFGAEGNPILKALSCGCGDFGESVQDGLLLLIEDAEGMISSRADDNRDDDDDGDGDGDIDVALNRYIVKANKEPRNERVIAPGSETNTKDPEPYLGSELGGEKKSLLKRFEEAESKVFPESDLNSSEDLNLHSRFQRIQKALGVSDEDFSSNIIIVKMSELEDDIDALNWRISDLREKVYDRKHDK